MRPLQVGDRICLKVRTVSGWKGEGIVSEPDYGSDPNRTIAFVRLGEELGDPPSLAARHEVALIRR